VWIGSGEDVSEDRPVGRRQEMREGVRRRKREGRWRRREGNGKGDREGDIEGDGGGNREGDGGSGVVHVAVISLSTDNTHKHTHIYTYTHTQPTDDPGHCTPQEKSFQCGCNSRSAALWDGGRGPGED
jgi:hypothetical protein